MCGLAGDAADGVGGDGWFYFAGGECGLVGCRCAAAAALCGSGERCDGALAGGAVAAAGAPVEWNFQLGALLSGMDAVWEKTGDRVYLRYIQAAIDQFVQPDGSILTYKPQAASMNDLVFGRRLLMLYRVTKEEKYRKAAELLRRQLATQPRTASGGFWHTKNNPNEMLIDDEFMADPFYAEYASMFGEPQDFADITKQFVLLDTHARDAKTGLLYHGWDEPYAGRGEQGYGDFAEPLGAGDGVDHDGSGGHAALLPEGRSGPCGGGGDFAAHGGGAGAVSG